MLNTKLLVQQLNKMMNKSTAAKEARIQIKLPRGEFHSADGFFDVVKSIEEAKGSCSACAIKSLAIHSGFENLSPTPLVAKNHPMLEESLHHDI